MTKKITQEDVDKAREKTRKAWKTWNKAWNEVQKLKRKFKEQNIEVKKHEI